MKLNSFLALGFLIVGLSVAMIGVILGVSSHRFVNNATYSEGVVIDLPFGGSHPLVEFVDKSDRKLQFTENGWIGGYKVGDKVTVAYDPSEPEYSAHINKIGAIYGSSIFLIVPGVIVAVFGILAYKNWGISFSR